MGAENNCKSGEGRHCVVVFLGVRLWVANDSETLDPLRLLS